MKNIKYEVGVGLVFFIALGILSYYTVIMSHKFFDPGKTYTVKVQFGDVSGLIPTSKVKINGVDSGSVESIHLINNKVYVTLRMYNTFTIYENYKIRIKSEAALGGRHVAIYPGASIDKYGKAFNLRENRENLTGKLDDPLSAFNDMIGDNRDNIDATIRNFKNITQKINSGKGSLAKLINKENVHLETVTLLNQTNKVLNQTGGLLRDLSEAVEDAREQAPITSFIRAALTAF